MIEPEKIDEYAESISEASITLSSNWKTILISALVCGLIVFPVVLYRTRSEWLPTAYSALRKGSTAPTLVDEWSRVSPTVYPEFFFCEYGSCQVDPEKKEEVSKILKSVLDKTNSELVLFNIYGEGYRQIVAQEAAVGSKRVSQAYWVAPIDTRGFDSNLDQHRIDECNSIAISTLPIDSYLRDAARVYKVSRIDTCPIGEGELPEYRVIGYISLSFRDEKQKDEKYLRNEIIEATEKIETVMGYN